MLGRCCAQVLYLLLHREPVLFKVFFDRVHEFKVLVVHGKVERLPQLAVAVSAGSALEPAEHMHGFRVSGIQKLIVAELIRLAVVQRLCDIAGAAAAVMVAEVDADSFCHFDVLPAWHFCLALLLGTFACNKAPGAPKKAFELNKEAKNTL